MKESLESFKRELLQKIDPSNLSSFILYGSSARGDFVPGKSDVNVMVVLEEIHLPVLSSVQKLVKKAAKKWRIVPVFWTERELRNSADVFPLEFLDMKKAYQVIEGKDVISELEIHTGNLRHQLEFELRSKLLHLRDDWFTLKGSRKNLQEFLIRAGTSYRYLFQHAEELLGEPLGESIFAPLKTCAQLRKKEIKLDRSALETLYEQVHGSLVNVIRKIDAL